MSYGCSYLQEKKHDAEIIKGNQVSQQVKVYLLDAKVKKGVQYLI